MEALRRAAFIVLLRFVSDDYPLLRLEVIWIIIIWIDGLHLLKWLFMFVWEESFGILELKPRIFMQIL